MALGRIWQSSYYKLVCVGVEYSGILYIRVFIAGEIYIALTKFHKLFDVDLIE